MTGQNRLVEGVPRPTGAGRPDQRWAWLLPIAFLFATSTVPHLALDSGLAFAGVWIVGGAVGYLWQVWCPRRLESRLLPWVAVSSLAILWMAATDGDPVELGDSASQLVGLAGILSGLVARGARDVRRRGDPQR
jgi:multisubunit Na+/H+ antiporter MnhB subunit